MLLPCPRVRRHHNDYVRIGRRLRVMYLAFRWRAGLTKLMHRVPDADCEVYIYIYICRLAKDKEGWGKDLAYEQRSEPRWLRVIPHM